MRGCSATVCGIRTVERAWLSQLHESAQCGCRKAARPGPHFPLSIAADFAITRRLFRAVAGLEGDIRLTSKIADFLAEQRPPTPCLVVDLELIEQSYRRICELMPLAVLHYAVKANPAPPVLERLAELGASFDAASLSEVEACLAAGAPPARISYGNTIKKSVDIARAYDLGVRLFAFDSEAELAKLAHVAPGSAVFCRIAVDGGTGARWPLAGKFGCSVAMARDLLLSARDLGLDPCGLSFHVGSQQCDMAPWDDAISAASGVFQDLAAAGLELRMLNLGGGFPVPYRSQVPRLEDVTGAIHRALTRHFGNRLPDIIAEPGRALVADAGVIRSEVVLVSRRDYGATERWVYLDVGKFGGLAETAGEAIQYSLRTDADGTATGPVILAGPTCDGADVLYRHAGYHLPLSLDVGDHIDFLAAGAYTATYASIGFNGFPPLQEYYI